MHRVHVMPVDLVLDVEAGGTVMNAAHVAGYYWPTTCGGLGECGLCAFGVDVGEGSLAPMSEYEERAMAAAPHVRPGHRLACQARVIGDLTLTKKGVRRAS